ncbi:hypothetical protein [Mucilaginibacter segetis]|uniref:Uncharacterized protein n=1 Tax=Mucilaginibacter segetis TaxID=2793071 RepID=A0A934PSM9_9SPHI|nr:hypothetical protein [Mucilaginibacter segetis]MBK0378305.1 hypothetical protein [Mucilaginibacter segetis]
MAGIEGYVVKCPKNNTHYTTEAGIIDIEDWNIHNTKLYEDVYELKIKNNFK